MGDFLEREQNKMAFYKLALIDNIQRKIDRIEENNTLQSDLVKEAKLYSSSVAQQKDRKIQQMEEFFVKQQKKVFYAAHNNLPLPQEHLPDHLVPSRTATALSISSSEPA
eukprot:NODE_563_length_1292_cov_113.478681_g406_i0.p6 GENE.NODE_563_length_1292_cov_113.478681_g406_i0~~NODE_563_length_1292_cov_113.478681_g406_i0.p6  ORF type:complete len:110 (+),score=65.71 NODE_563_length_1292_cov_113.478681_g406_i0:31-360(+)